jgi:hypothetical protein
VAHEEGSASGAPVWGRVTDASVLVGTAGDDTTPSVDGGCANEAKPRPEDAPSAATLVLRSLRGSGFSPDREATLDNMMSIPMSFNIIDPETGELGLSGYPQHHLRPPAGSKWQGVSS